MYCPNCDSHEVVKKGIVELATGTIKQRYKCKDCGSSFSEAIDESPEDLFAEEIEVEDKVEQFQYLRSDSWLESNVYSKKRLVITSAQNSTPVDVGFLKSLKTYCDHTGAGLVVIPTKYKTVNAQDDLTVDSYDESVVPFLCENTLTFPKHNVKVYAGFKISATAENPLSGLDPLSKGWTVIVGHAQVQLKTLPNIDKRISDILSTTGSITEKNYSRTKLGEKAKFNHSMSAIVIEFDEKNFHLRHLNYDEVRKSFWDLDTCYSAKSVTKGSIEALITGDEHVIFRDPLVEQNTYTNYDSMVAVLKPAYIVRHDILDAYSISHHHQKNVFTKFAKWQSGMNSIESELNLTIAYINKTTPKFSKSLIIQSNHNEHLLRWLNEVDIKQEPWNAKIYHYLMWLMLANTKMGENGAEYPDPFRLYSSGRLSPNAEFVDRCGKKILGIEVGSHGDRGINGARGSALGFSRIPDKMIVGHSHSPQIQKGCYVVGTSSKLSLEYNSGASTWHHAHCIIHKNGKRQLVFITETGWRLS